MAEENKDALDGLRPKGIQRLRELRKENDDLRSQVATLEQELEQERLDHRVDTLTWQITQPEPSAPPGLANGPPPVKEEAEPSGPGTSEGSLPVEEENSALQEDAAKAPEDAQRGPPGDTPDPDPPPEEGPTEPLPEKEEPLQMAEGSRVRRGGKRLIAAEEPAEPDQPAPEPSSAKTEEKLTPKRKLWKVLGEIMFYAALALALVLAVMIRTARQGAPLSIAGYSGMIVLSESMQDTIPKGSFVITKAVEPETLEVGDDITYMANATTSVTHRIIDIYEVPEEQGGIAFQTKGTSNTQPDKNLVNKDNVVGKVIYHNLAIGQFAQLLSENWPYVLFLVVVWLGFGQVIRWLFRGGEEKKKKKE